MRHPCLGFARARGPDCGHDFLVAFACKRRALCPSCNARRMAETAAHLVDHVFPPRPVRHWVLAVPKRLRWYLEREPQALSAVLHILLRVIEVHLCQASGASSHARLGAVSFIHRSTATSITTAASVRHEVARVFIKERRSGVLPSVPYRAVRWG
jgi:hypothetical protein